MVSRIQLGSSMEKPVDSHNAFHHRLIRGVRGRRILIMSFMLCSIILYMLKTSDLTTLMPYNPQDILSSYINPEIPVSGNPSSSSSSSPSPSHSGPPPPVETSMLHLLLPATSPKPKLCKTILSAALLNYPLPVLINWGMEEHNNEYQLHLAKIEGILEYLRGMPPRNDQDLVLIADGHDVWFQLRPDVLIQRYYHINADLARLSSQGFAKPGDAETNNITQTVIFGADKKCWPQTPDQAACYAVPESTLPEEIYGEMTDKDPNHFLIRPRWLNSGVILGPVADVRAIFEAAAYKVEYRFHGERDQWYFAEIFGEQEYHRGELRKSKAQKAQEQRDAVEQGKVLSPAESGMLRKRSAAPDDEADNDNDNDGENEEGENHDDDDDDDDDEDPPRKVIPLFHDGQQLEYHIGMDYESQLMQTMTHSAADVDWVTFNASSPIFANMLADHDIHVDASYTISAHLPADVASSFPPLYSPYLSDVLQESSMKSYDDMNTPLPVNTTWGDVPLLVNLRANSIPVMIHINGNKTLLDTLWPETWWVRQGWARHLLRAGARAPRGPIAVTTTPDGVRREWYKGEWNSMRRENGGVWTDKGQWLLWAQVCEQFEDVLFQEGEEDEEQILGVKRGS